MNTPCTAYHNNTAALLLLLLSCVTAAQLHATQPPELGGDHVGAHAGPHEQQRRASEEQRAEDHRVDARHAPGLHVQHVHEYHAGEKQHDVVVDRDAGVNEASRHDDREQHASQASSDEQQAERPVHKPHDHEQRVRRPVDEHLDHEQHINEGPVRDQLAHKQHARPSPAHKRVRRGPAVWGAPVPDYSGLQLDGPPTYVYGVLFVDEKITNHYKNNTDHVKQELMQLCREANKYLNQLDIRLVVVDIVPIYRNDLSLYSFEEFRLSRQPSLPYHDFAALISYRYAGGLAFVNGMCSTKSVMLTGFYPHSPRAMGSIFFHELAHLLGVSHATQHEPIQVPRCACPPSAYNNNNNQSPSTATQSADGVANSLVPETGPGCLRIPGFDHNCTAQVLANVLYRNRCLSRMPRSHAQNFAEGFATPSRTDPELLKICGNGVVEASEECDCGLPQMCTNWNCEPLACRRIIPLWKMFLFGFVAIIAGAVFLYAYVRSRYQAYLAVKPPMNVSDDPSRLRPNCLSRFLGAAFSSLLFWRCFGRKPKPQPPKVSREKLDPASIVVIRTGQLAQTTRMVVQPGRPELLPAPTAAPLKAITPRSEIRRPRCPPPTRPPDDRTQSLTRPRVLPPRPPPPGTRRLRDRPNPNITYKFADFD